MISTLAAVFLQVSTLNQQVDWVSVGISTGKFSESISSRVFDTEAECKNDFMMEDRTCFPIPALPVSYWEEQKNRNIEGKKRVDALHSAQEASRKYEEGKLMADYELCQKRAPSLSELLFGKRCVKPNINQNQKDTQ